MFLVIALLFSYVKEFRHFRIITGLDFNCKANNLVPGLFLLHGFQSFRSKMKLIGCKVVTSFGCTRSPLICFCPEFMGWLDNMESDNFSQKIPEKNVGNTSQAFSDNAFPRRSRHAGDMQKLARTARPERHRPRAIMRPRD